MYWYQRVSLLIGLFLLLLPASVQATTCGRPLYYGSPFQEMIDVFYIAHRADHLIHAKVINYQTQTLRDRKIVRYEMHVVDSVPALDATQIVTFARLGRRGFDGDGEHTMMHPGEEIIFFSSASAVPEVAEQDVFQIYMGVMCLPNPVLRGSSITTSQRIAATLGHYPFLYYPTLAVVKLYSGFHYLAWFGFIGHLVFFCGAYILWRFVIWNLFLRRKMSPAPVAGFIWFVALLAMVDRAVMEPTFRNPLSGINLTIAYGVFGLFLAGFFHALWGWRKSGKNEDPFPANITERLLYYVYKRRVFHYLLPVFAIVLIPPHLMATPGVPAVILCAAGTLSLTGRRYSNTHYGVIWFSALIAMAWNAAAAAAGITIANAIGMGLFFILFIRHVYIVRKNRTA